MMRSFWTIALLGIALLPLTADDPVEKRAENRVDAQAPTINIQPRSRTAPTAAGETILDRRSDLRIDTTLVLVPVSVTLAATGKLLTGLEKENFELSEDKVAQEIASFGSEDVPLSIGIVFDCSGSMSKVDIGPRHYAITARSATSCDVGAVPDTLAAESSSRP